MEKGHWLHQGVLSPVVRYRLTVSDAKLGEEAQDGVECLSLAFSYKLTLSVAQWGDETPGCSRANVSRLEVQANNIAFAVLQWCSGAVVQWWWCSGGVVVVLWLSNGGAVVVWFSGAVVVQ